MSTRQREERRAMIKRRRTPSRCCVALSTIMVELTRHMIRVRRDIKVCSMTIPARMREVLVLVVNMATVASNRLMSACQRELGAAVIKGRRHPHRSCMAWTAVVIEVAKHMIWIRGLGEPGLMALVTVCKMQLVVAVHVTRLARCCNVSAGQREERRAMVECCRAPSCC